MEILRIADVEAALGESASKWAGRCYEIASKIVKAGLVEGVAVYGHYSGYIDPKSYFGKRSNGPFVQHGWILKEDGSVVDPTRFAFETSSPYVFQAHPDDEDALLCRNCHHFGSLHANNCDECKSTGEACDYFLPEPWPYDEGGQQFRRGFFRPAPAVNADDKRHTLPVTDEVSQFIANKLGQDQGKLLTMSQVCFVASSSYLDIEDAVGLDGVYDLYKAIAGLDNCSISFIPIDNLMKAERETGKQIDTER